MHLRAASPSELVALAHDVQARLRTDSLRSAGVVNSFGLASLLPDSRDVAKRQAVIDVNRVADELRAALSEAGFRAEAYESYVAFLRKLASPGVVPDASSLINYGEFGQLLLPRDVLERGAFDLDRILDIEPDFLEACDDHDHHHDHPEPTRR